MTKSPEKADVLVIGEHPSAYVAATLLRHKTRLSVVHALPAASGQPDRLVRINPEFFDLHALLGPLKRRLPQTAVYGLQFVSEDGQTRSEWRSRATVVTVASISRLCRELAKQADQQEVTRIAWGSLVIQQVDETGADVLIDDKPLRVRGIIASDSLQEAHRRMLGVPDGWDDQVIHRLTWVAVKGAQKVTLGGKPLAAVSLDLMEQRAIGWLLPEGDGGQLMVLEPQGNRGTGATAGPVLRRWADVLVKHGLLESSDWPEWGDPQTMELPLAGALAREAVANRTLLIGPAGGFYSASGEDIYPNCWSALHAAEVMKKSLREEHLQDALNAYRSRWRTTLGDYLRGPQQNLRFLLPLVYRNPVMTQRLAEAILLGRSVVR